MFVTWKLVYMMSMNYSGEKDSGTKVEKDRSENLEIFLSKILNLVKNSNFTYLS